MINYKKVKQTLIDFLRNEVNKAGFKNVTLGLSGGLDSSIVAVLCKEVFEDNLNCVLLPTQFSSKASIDDAVKLCEKFNIKYETVKLDPMLNAYLKNMQNNNLRIGNFSARLRMAILYDISARDKSLVIGTSNKSEILLGYGTIFGDMAYAINPLGNIYKSDLFKFAKFLSIPQNIIDKKPSADLWKGQSDESDLGYSYTKIDSLLKVMIDKNKTKEELISLGFEDSFIEKISKRIKINKFKRKLPTIAKI